MAKWRERKGMNPEYILNQLEVTKKLTEDGRVSFESFTSSECKVALQSMIQFGENVSMTTRSLALNKALFEAAKTKLDKNNLMLKINEEIKKKFATREENYYLLTSISYVPPFLLTKVKIGSCEIKFLKKDYPKKFIVHRKNLINSIARDKVTSKPYCKVIVKTKNNGTHEAAEACLNALNLLRGFLCLQINPPLAITLGSSTLKPINRVILGPAHTLHLESGKIATESFWYEPNFVNIDPCKLNLKDVPIIKANFDWIFKKLDKIDSKGFKKEICNAVIRFVSAFDHTDYQSSVIMGWGSLESLASNEKDANNDIIPRRCSFLFPDSQYHKQIIEHIREYRNNNVHYGEVADETDLICYQLQRYFKRLVFFYIGNANNYANKEEANSFLDLPSTIDALKKKSTLIKRAIKYVTPPKSMNLSTSESN
jgi:hypothetical protein